MLLDLITLMTNSIDKTGRAARIFLFDEFNVCHELAKLLDQHVL